MREQMRNSIFYIVIAIVVIGVATVAWFANQTLVNSEGLLLSANDTRFEVRTKEETNFEQTSSSSNTWLLYDKTYFGKDIKNAMYPGARGSITFYIVPKATDLNSITYKLSLDAWQEGTDNDNNYVYDSVNAEPVYLKNTEEIPGVEYLNYLNGHVLFFKEHFVENNQDYYSDLIDFDNEITLDLSSLTKNDSDEYEVTIHWVWPLSFYNYIETKQGSENIFSSANVSEMEEMIALMNTNKEHYFHADNLSGSGTDLGDLTVKKYEDMGNEKFILDRYYNNADQYIGENIDYLTLNISVWELRK